MYVYAYLDEAGGWVVGGRGSVVAAVAVAVAVAVPFPEGYAPELRRDSKGACMASTAAAKRTIGFRSQSTRAPEHQSTRARAVGRATAKGRTVVSARGRRCIC